MRKHSSESTALNQSKRTSLTSLKTILPASLTESGGKFGLLLLRHLHSCLWSSQASFYEDFLKREKKKIKCILFYITCILLFYIYTQILYYISLSTVIYAHTHAQNNAHWFSFVVAWGGNSTWQDGGELERMLSNIHKTLGSCSFSNQDCRDLQSPSTALNAAALMQWSSFQCCKSCPQTSLSWWGVNAHSCEY